MKISENWLREWVNPSISSGDLVAQITLAGLEVDEVLPVASEFSGVVVGEITSAEPHPNADKLQVCQVSDGVEVFQVVCGAPNARVGIKIPFARIGAVLGADFKIKKAKLRQVESFGMLCSASELGLSDDHDGIMELPLSAIAGEDFRAFLELDDQIIDVDLTPNRSDCLSIAGLAREVGVLNKTDVTPVNITPAQIVIDDTFSVRVDAADACPRYLGRVIRGVDVKAQTPLWMVEKLRRSGIRSIDPIVDITNFVMLELGQPMHAFDLANLSGSVVVRKAIAGEKITLLDGQDIALREDTLLIADEKAPLAIAGIMGGKGSGVNEETKDIFLESAFFTPLALAGKARSYGLHTDSSHRFERGVDATLQEKAIERATALVIDIAGGQVGPITHAVNEASLPEAAMVTLRRKKLDQYLAMSIDKDLVTDILTRLGLEMIEVTSEAWTTKAPSHRFDMGIEEDLIEEIARIYGYDNIPSVLPHLQVSMDYDDTADLTHEMKLALVDNGYMEAISFSFSDAKLEALLDDEALGEVLALANPISSDLAVMRRTLLSSLLPCVQYNLNRQQPRVRFFETGLSFVGQSISDLVQTPSIALVAVGDIWSEQAYQNRALDFYDLKHDIEQLLPAQTDSARIRYERSTLSFLHPGQSAELYIDDIYVGWLGQLHPNTAKQLDLPTTWVAQLSLAPLLTTAREQHAITTPSKFPQVRRDIAILVDSDISLQTLETTVRTAAGNMLTDLWLFDVYQGDKVPEGQRSLAFALIWQDSTQTLSDEAVKTATDKVVQALTDQHSVQLRDS